MKIAVLLLALLSALVACESPTSDRQSAGCAECANETEALGEQIAKINGVREVMTIRYVTQRNITRPPAVAVEIGIDPGTLDDVAEAIAEIGWKSRVDPLAVINIVSVEPGGRPESTAIEYFENRTNEYESKWGPRPVG